MRDRVPQSWLSRRTRLQSFRTTRIANRIDAPPEPHQLRRPRDVPRARRALRARHFRLLFVGRMDLLKGGRVFIDALARAEQRLQAQARRNLYRRRARTSRVGTRSGTRAKLEIRTCASPSRDGSTVTSSSTHLNDCDLLVFPSLWPEPFGLVGPEAGLHGVPVAAFAVGGVPDWLVDGVNGFLASGDPPTADGLTEAIVKCLSDDSTHARLRRGAVEVAQRFSLENHMAVLLDVFYTILEHAPEQEVVSAAALS